MLIKQTSIKTEYNKYFMRIHDYEDCIHFSINDQKTIYRLVKQMQLLIDGSNYKYLVFLALNKAGQYLMQYPFCEPFLLPDVNDV